MFDKETVKKLLKKELTEAMKEQMKTAVLNIMAVLDARTKKDLKALKDVYELRDTCCNLLAALGVDAYKENVCRDIKYDIVLLKKYRIIITELAMSEKTYKELIETEKKLPYHSLDLDIPNYTYLGMEILTIGTKFPDGQIEYLEDGKLRLKRFEKGHRENTKKIQDIKVKKFMKRFGSGK